MEYKGRTVYFYSAKTGGFYDLEIFGSNLPSDVCEVSSEEYAQLMLASSRGKVIRPDEEGRPVISEAQEPTQEQIHLAERTWRDYALLESCKVRDRHRDEQELFRPTTLSPARFVELLEYIQKLRDWPQSADFPDVALRPSAPHWLDDQSR